jgi:hypothetical protein
VSGLVLLDRQKRANGLRVGGDDEPAASVGVGHEEPACLRVVGGECDREQALLGCRRTPRARPDERPDVEERCAANRSVLDDPDDARLLDDIEAPGLTGRGREVDRPVEPACDLDGANAFTRRRGRGRLGLGVRAAAGEDERSAKRGGSVQSRNSPRATTTADPPTSTRSIPSLEPSARA